MTEPIIAADRPGYAKSGMDRIVNLSKRRGLVFPSSDIYGGFRSTWDYGPLGVLLKRNVKDAWWRSMVQMRDDWSEEIEAALAGKKSAQQALDDAVARGNQTLRQFERTANR